MSPPLSSLSASQLAARFNSCAGHCTPTGRDVASVERRLIKCIAKEMVNSYVGSCPPPPSLLFPFLTIPHHPYPALLASCEHPAASSSRSHLLAVPHRVACFWRQSTSGNVLHCADVHRYPAAPSTEQRRALVPLAGLKDMEIVGDVIRALQDRVCVSQRMMGWGPQARGAGEGQGGKRVWHRDNL